MKLGSVHYKSSTHLIPPLLKIRELVLGICFVPLKFPPSQRLHKPALAGYIALHPFSGLRDSPLPEALLTVPPTKPSRDKNSETSNKGQEEWVKYLFLNAMILLLFFTCCINQSLFIFSLFESFYTNIQTAKVRNFLLFFKI